MCIFYQFQYKFFFLFHKKNLSYIEIGILININRSSMLFVVVSGGDCCLMRELILINTVCNVEFTIIFRIFVLRMCFCNKMRIDGASNKILHS